MLPVPFLRQGRLASTCSMSSPQAGAAFRSIGKRATPGSAEAIQRWPQPRRGERSPSARAMPNRTCFTVADEAHVDLIVMGSSRSGSTASDPLEQLHQVVFPASRSPADAAGSRPEGRSNPKTRRAGTLLH